MDIQLFQTFLLVAKLNNITQAAEQLNFTQPAVTSQIRALEEHYGVQLFERIGKKLHITEAGRELTAHLEELLTVYKRIDGTMREYSTADRQLKVGASTSAATYVLSPALLELQNRLDSSAVVFDICHQLSTTVKGLLDNEFDIIIVHSKINHPQILQFDLFDEKLVWVASRELIAAHNFSQDISEYPFINFRPGSVYRTHFEEITQGKKFRTVLEYSDAEAIKRAVLDGVGASVLPYVIIEPLLADGTLQQFENEPQFTFFMSVAFNKNKVLTPAMRELLAAFAGQAHMQNGLSEYLLSRKNP